MQNTFVNIFKAYAKAHEIKEVKTVNFLGVIINSYLT